MAALRLCLLGCLLSALNYDAAAVSLPRAEFNPARGRPSATTVATSQRVIVKMRDAVVAKATARPSPDARLKSIGARGKLSLRSMRAIAKNLQVVELESQIAGETAQQALERLRADPDVQYAVPDRAVYAHATSNDPLAPGQWYLTAAQPSAINANSAWDATTGSNGVVIAILDTGARFEHPDLKRASLGGRLLPGYDFISANSSGGFFTANDGDGRDADAADAGDWVASSEVKPGCNTSSNSSWHGTRVAGIIGALTNNSAGLAGISWGGWLLPVRVLGKCGGVTSDILAAMLWAAGQRVDGVPDNPFPAQILNLSLGSAGACDAASADVVRTLSAQGVLIVASAGNEGGPVDSPANCPGAAAIAGLRHIGTKVGFSSLGPEIALGAPGGNCVNVNGGPCLFSIDTTSNDGLTTAGSSTYTDQTNANVGTSFSAPIVSGIGALMLSVNGNLKSAQLIARLREGASKPFPVSTDSTVPQCRVPTGPSDVQAVECSCTTSTCGAGMANAAGAVTAALRPIAAIAIGSSITPGGNVTLQGGGSAAACGRSVASHAWTVVSSSGAPPGIVGANTATAVVVAPATGTTTLRLTVTDNLGRQDAAEITLSSNSASTSAPANAGNSACRAAVIVPLQLPLISVTATDASAAEPGTDTGTFTLTRSGDLGSALAVSIVISGTATSGVDYQSLPTTVNFPAGQASATLTVTPIDDVQVEAAESVTLTIVDDAPYDLETPNNATVTINDNDVAPPVVPAASGGGGGGGGGALGMPEILWLLALLAAALLPAPTRAGFRRSKARSARWSRVLARR